MKGTGPFILLDPLFCFCLAPTFLPAAIAEGALQIVSGGEAADPGIAPQGAAAFAGGSDGVQFPVGLRAIHQLDPISGPLDGPIAQQFSYRFGSDQAGVQTAPSPVLGAFHGVGAQRISLDIAKHPLEMFILLDHEILEPSLINMAHSDGVMGDLPTCGMGEAEITEEL